MTNDRRTIYRLAVVPVALCHSALPGGREAT